MKISSVLVVLLGATLITGCANTGAILVGGVSGAALGGITGGTTGVVLGAAAGVFVGGLVGNYLDEQEAAHLKDHSTQTYQRVDNGGKLSVNDLINLSQIGIANDTIIELIQKTNSHYTLHHYQIEKLWEAGVSESIINYMMYNP